MLGFEIIEWFLTCRKRDGVWVSRLLRDGRADVAVARCGGPVPCPLAPPPTGRCRWRRHTGAPARADAGGGREGRGVLRSEQPRRCGAVELEGPGTDGGGGALATPRASARERASAPGPPPTHANHLAQSGRSVAEQRVGAARCAVRVARVCATDRADSAAHHVPSWSACAHTRRSATGCCNTRRPWRPPQLQQRRRRGPRPCRLHRSRPYQR